MADAATVLGQAAEVSGSWRGAVSPVFLGAILFGSRFGTFWWMRQLVALAALLLAVITARRPAGEPVASAATGTPPGRQELADDMNDDMNGREGREGREGCADSDVQPIPEWRRELIGVLRSVPHLPRRLVGGWQLRSRAGRVMCVLAAALLVAYALSGHAAAVPASEFTYAIGVDLVHLLCQAAWIGGLFYISAVFVPALGGLPAHTRARVLALGLPEFGAVAIVSAVLLAATGSLNTTIRLTSITQFLTTAYGKTLAIKIELFLIMVAISFYHAFVLRPGLVAALRERSEGANGARGAATTATSGEQGATVAEASVAKEGARQAERRLAGVAPSVAPPQARTPSAAPPPARTPEDADKGDGGPQREPGAVGGDAGTRSDSAQSVKSGEAVLPGPVRALEERLSDWLRREALLGGALLLCVALLGIFAGSLFSPLGQATGAATAGTAGAVVQTHHVSGYAVTLKVTPDTFGRNDFTITVKNAQAQPVNGATVTLELTNADMDMGVQNARLQPLGPSAPGSYSEQADLTMAGHWQVAVKVLPPRVQQPLVTVFTFSASY